ncbi:MAG: glycosyltransferase family 4 protein [Bacteroidales bacterium]|nr:glycosyltransferase family 4 protein [Bacteroidales bacterium]MCF8333946.1 glycosyltransferase family 4 protein [Bacteroidales bacterium]
MKVLFICNKSPYPRYEGGPIAMNRLIEGMLDKGHEVKVLAINSQKYQVNIHEVPKAYREKTGLELHFLDLSIKPFAAFKNLFTKRSYHVERFISKDFEERIVRILEENEFDIIQFETLYMAPYIETIRSLTNAPIILRAHNIEHQIWERVRKTTANPLKKFYLGHITRTLKRYEINSLSKFDGIAAITTRDAEQIKEFDEQARVTDIPFGIYPGAFKVASLEESEFPSLFHIGSMNWMPNEEGIKWFVDEVWPMVHRQVPEVTLYLAGRHMPPWLKNLHKDKIEVVGEVDSAESFMASKGVMIVPLLSGSGIRIKIIEGMAAGKPVVSTGIGAEGIECNSGKDILLADSPEGFADSVVALLQDKQKAIEIGQNARRLIEEKYDNAAIVGKLETFYRKIMAEKDS